MRTMSILLGTYLSSLSALLADTLVFTKGEAMTGTVLQTNNDEILFAAPYGTMHFGLAGIREIKLNHPAAPAASTNRLPEIQTLLALLSKQPWATKLEQIPATVVDTGMLKFVPYESFRAGADYELNIYGDLSSPAGIEIGIYRSLLTNAPAKKNCVEFMSAAMNRLSDIEQLIALDPQKDQKVSNGLTFEITPPTDPDAYGGWWVSVYDEAKINKSRASEEEIRRITVSKKDVASGTNNASGWSGVDLSKSRPYHQMSEYHPNPTYNVDYIPDSSSGSYSGSSYSGGGGGRVYVHGYTKANGTYVQPYTRSAPHRR